MKVVLIAGPTASGKSSAAISVAQKLDGVIVNADSMQVYRELDILTSRPSRADEKQIEHRLYGYLPAAERCSVARWLDDAGREIAALVKEDRTVVVVGGTGLYFKVLELGLAPVPEISQKVRADLRAQLVEQGAAVMHELLLEQDRPAAEKLEVNDSQRILRALEVVQSTGKPLAYFHQKAVQSSVLAGLDVEKLVLMPARELLYERINQRFDEMINEGALDEVKRLRALDLPDDLPVMKAIGMRSLGGYLDGDYDLDEGIRIAKQETRNYAKRQMTWLRNQMADWPRFERGDEITF